jgi:hypothetical protein
MKDIFMREKVGYQCPWFMKEPKVLCRKGKITINEKMVKVTLGYGGDDRKYYQQEEYHYINQNDLDKTIVPLSEAIFKIIK